MPSSTHTPIRHNTAVNATEGFIETPNGFVSTIYPNRDNRASNAETQRRSFSTYYVHIVLSRRFLFFVSWSARSSSHMHLVVLELVLDFTCCQNFKHLPAPFCCPPLFSACLPICFCHFLSRPIKYPLGLAEIEFWLLQPRVTIYNCGHLEHL